jgi:hypothetical protein
MTLSELKNKIANKFETNPDNIIITINNKDYHGTSDESRLRL